MLKLVGFGLVLLLGVTVFAELCDDTPFACDGTSYFTGAGVNCSGTCVNAQCCTTCQATAGPTCANPACSGKTCSDGDAATTGDACNATASCVGTPAATTGAATSATDSATDTGTGPAATSASPSCSAIPNGGSGTQVYTSNCATGTPADGSQCILTCSTSGYGGSTTKTCTAGTWSGGLTGPVCSAGDPGGKRCCVPNPADPSKPISQGFGVTTGQCTFYEFENREPPIYAYGWATDAGCARMQADPTNYPRLVCCATDDCNCNLPSGDDPRGPPIYNPPADDKPARIDVTTEGAGVVVSPSAFAAVVVLGLAAVLA